jgi:hypothetical protein
MILLRVSLWGILFFWESHCEGHYSFESLIVRDIILLEVSLSGKLFFWESHCERLILLKASLWWSLFFWDCHCQGHYYSETLTAQDMIFLRVWLRRTQTNSVFTSRQYYSGWFISFSETPRKIIFTYCKTLWRIIFRAVELKGRKLYRHVSLRIKLKWKIGEIKVGEGYYRLKLMRLV